MKMKFFEGQRVLISNEKRKCTPYNQYNGAVVIIEGINDFLRLYEITLNNQKWALHEEGLKKIKEA